MKTAQLGPHRVPTQLGFLLAEDEADAAIGNYSNEAVMTMLLNNQREILLNLRDDFSHILYPNHWAMLGGTVDQGETLEDAVRREITEEIGYRISESAEFCKVIDRLGAGHLVTIFVAPITASASDLTLSEGADLRYFSHGELSDLKMTPFLKEVVIHFYETWHGIENAST